jgi:cation diffusion facilitator family transporter
MKVKTQETLSLRLQPALKSVALGLLINVVLAGAKISAGIWGNSNALIADGVESTLDIFSSLIVLTGLSISVRPADQNHPYGHGKAESLAVLFVATGLLIVATLIAIKSIEEIHHPQAAPASFTLIVLVGVVVIKEFLFRRILSSGESINSLSLKTDAWHHRLDAITSLAAFIGISIALLFGKGYESADDWAALMASLIIGFNGLYLLQHAVKELMDHAPSPQTIEAIRTIAANIEGVDAIEKCRIRKSGTQLFVDIHVEVNGQMSVDRAHTIAHSVKDALVGSSLGIVDVLVHIEPSRPSRL